MKENVHLSPFSGNVFYATFHLIFLLFPMCVHLLLADAVKAVWRQCDAVCFDVDSTVLKEEGLDELARFLGKGEEIAAL